MRKGIKLALGLVFVLVLRLVLVPSAHAVCPICTVAVAAGLGLSRWLGIDDAVSSVWIGGLILSVSFWSIDWVHKSKFKYKSKYLDYSIVAFWYLFVLGPLAWTNIIGHPFNTILGIDKILFGTVVGSAVFLLALWADKKVRQIKGRQLFPFQKVVFPIVSLVIISLVIYFYGGYLY